MYAMWKLSLTKRLERRENMQKILYAYIGKAKDFKIIEIKKDQSAATDNGPNKKTM